MFRIIYAVYMMQMKENENPTIILISPEEVKWKDLIAVWVVTNTDICITVV